MKLKCFGSFWICLFLFILPLFQVQALEASAGCVECSSSQNPLKIYTEFACDMNSMASDCKAWFDENPETIKYAKDCKKNQSPEADNWLNACLAAGIENWAEILSLFTESANAIEACNNNMDCKIKLAKDAFFACKNKDGSAQYPCRDQKQLQEVYAGDLMRKRDQVRTLALHDQNYRKKLETAGVPLPPQIPKGLDLSPGLLKQIAEAKMQELGVKYSCYNSAGYSHMACYAIASIVDPTIVVATPGVALKGVKWVNAVMHAKKVKKDLERAAWIQKMSKLPKVKGELVPGEAKAKLQEFLNTYNRDVAHPHFMYEKDGKTVLKIGLLKRNEKQFMALVTKALRAGEISSIDAGRIEGPKVFAVISRLKHEALAAKTDLTITGQMSPAAIRSTFRSQNRYSIVNDGSADLWTKSEVDAFHHSYEDLGLKGCDSKSVLGSLNFSRVCSFTLTIRQGQSDMQLRQTRGFSN